MLCVDFILALRLRSTETRVSRSTVTRQLGGAIILRMYLLTWLLFTDIAIQDVKIKGVDNFGLMIYLNIVSPLIADAIHIKVKIASGHSLCCDSGMLNTVW